jgi:hypothetical protein
MHVVSDTEREKGTMTRQDIDTTYKIRTDGRIATPGKFEGEPIYAPTFWDCALNGEYSEDVNGVFFFQLDDTDREVFPELSDVAGIALEENDQGFVTATEFGSMAGYYDSVQRMEREAAAEECY